MLTLLLAALTPRADACDGLVAEPEQVISSDAQQALLEVHDADVTVTYRVRYQGDATSFAWILPVPGEILSVEEGDSARLDHLFAVSAPTFQPYTAPEEGGGCLRPATKTDDGGGSEETFDGVTVTGSGFAGDFSYLTLTADDADGLAAWLTENGYDFSVMEDEIAAYVADPLGFQWVVVQLRSDLPPEGVSHLAPLSIRYGAADDGALHPLFPARMGHSSQLESDRLEIAVIADHFAALDAPWATSPASDVSIPNGADAGAFYTSLLASLGERDSFQRVYGNTYREEPGAALQYLTRYDGLFAPDHLTADASFTLDRETSAADTDNTSLTLQEEAPDSGLDGLAPLALPLALLGLSARRRKA